MRKRERLGKVSMVMAWLLLAIPLAACGATHASTPSGTEIDTTSSNFVQHAVTTSAGQTIRFVDPATSGAFHQLCLGINQQCDTAAQGPAKLMSPGFTLNAGQTVNVTFPTAGTYQITCTVHPNMNLTVTVT